MNSLKSTSVNSMLPPYSLPVSESIISLDGEQLLATIKVRGVTFETVDHRTLDNFFNSEKSLFNNLCQKYGSKLAVWTHIVKKKDKLENTFKFKDTFMNAFSDKYFERFSNQKFYTTDYYITYVLKHSDIHEGIAELEEVISLTNNVFKEFNATTLEFFESKGGVFFSENISFLSFLFNNYFPDVPLTHDRIDSYLGKSDLHFGYDTLEIRNHESDDSRFAVLYELNSYPNATVGGMWDFVLSLQQEFIICQSMIFMSTSKTLKMMDEQINIVSSSSSGSQDDVDEIQWAKNNVANGDVSFGDYHASMMVFGNDVSEALENGSAISSEFLSRGTSWQRANLKSPFTFQSMMPASKTRPLSCPKTITNLVCAFSLHNYSTGKKTGNPIGDGSALMPLKTISDSLFYLNAHASDYDKNVTGQPIAGHTMLLGATGSGKTTLEGVMVGFATRFDVAIFAIDYNRSTELFIRAYGGKYFTIDEGEDTGLNPFQLSDSPKLRSFLYSLVGRCGASNQGLTATEEKMIKDAVDTVMSLDYQNRRFSMILQSIPNGCELRLRLSKWCYSESGSLAWALDAAENKFNPSEFNRIGFDTTTILKSTGGTPHPACEAILGTLFFMKELMQTKGQLLLTIVEEFWKPASFPLTEELMLGILKAGRLKWEFMLLASQSPEDAIKCNIFETLVQQTPTKILLPNPAGDAESYKKIGLTDREIELVLSLGKDSRKFLVKQSQESVLAKLDLYGFNEFLPIISGNTEDVILCEEIRKLISSDDPEKWIPIMQKVKRNKITVEDCRSLHGNNIEDWLPKFLNMDM